MGLIGSLAGLIGAEENGLTLLLTLFAGYPLAAIYRAGVWKQTPMIQYAYFALAGLGMIVFNYGWGVCHSLFAITMTYLICRFFKGTQQSIVLAYIFLFGHLMLGYWFAESDQYDISWTTPHCILTLRLIGLVMDVYDGHQKEETVRADRRHLRITDVPSLLEIAAYTYFFGSLLIGPQYPLQRLRDLVNGKFLKDGVVRDSVKTSAFRLAIGMIYLTVHQWGAVWFGGLNAYLLTDDFLNRAFFAKILWVLVWFKLTLAKYQACWLITEGSNILATLAYNGEEMKKGVMCAKWDGVRDMRISVVEFGSGCACYVDGFNVNTNRWVKVHIFQRLRWLGNKHASHLLTLLFLALWHGYHLGYFILFFCEFATILEEAQMVKLVERVPALRTLFKRVPGLRYVLGKLILLLVTSFLFLSFGMIKKERWFTVYYSMYCYIWILMFVVWPLIFHFGMKAYPSGKSKEGKEHQPNLDKEISQGEAKKEE